MKDDKPYFLVRRGVPKREERTSGCCDDRVVASEGDAP
jgi:hypothetical protein